MKIYKKIFDSCIIFKTDQFDDKRGQFSEIYNEKIFKKKINNKFIAKQINFIYSKKKFSKGSALSKISFFSNENFKSNKRKNF